MVKRGDAHEAKRTLFRLASEANAAMEAQGETNVPYYLAQLRQAMALDTVTRDREKKGL